MEKKNDAVRRVTTRDIARECGVSQTTVSMILSGKSNVSFSEETLALVKGTAARLGYVYRPRQVKKEDRLKKTIMILCPSLATQYYTSLIQSITEYARTREICTLTAYTTRTEKMEEYYLRMAADQDFLGLICTYPIKAKKILNEIAAKIPLVMISDYNPELKTGFLELDSKKSGSLVARHLLELGHRRAAYITTPLSGTELPRLRRLEGIREEFERKGVGKDSVLVLADTEEMWQTYRTGNRHYESGYRMTMQYFRKPDRVTAFIGTNDMVAIGILDALNKLGCRVPEDYSVCGFDNTLLSSFSGISLTTVDHCIEEKGRSAVEMIVDQRRNDWDKSQHRRGKGESREGPVTRIEYQPLLVARRSSGPPPAVKSQPADTEAGRKQ